MLLRINVAFAALLVLVLVFVSSHNVVAALSPSSSISSTHRKQHLQVAVIQQEVDALLTWKSSLINQTHSLLFSWKRNSAASTTSPCMWYGITCNKQGSVVKLNLTTLDLQGTLHSFNFSSFSNIISLNFRYNKLFGTIPSQIGNLSKLTYLDLSFNEFSGRIPSEIGFLSSLRYLDLSHNQINGSIPVEIGSSHFLTHLWLGKNNLVGSIPTCICNLTKLSILSIYSNIGSLNLS
ncbi:hypothetical protein MKW92_049012 [Papaver armeniacum]|nr:hypothetical protein MKW92_049012 [Papaver armeniacum]